MLGIHLQAFVWPAHVRDALEPLLLRARVHEYTSTRTEDAEGETPTRRVEVQQRGVIWREQRKVQYDKVQEVRGNLPIGDWSV